MSSSESDKAKERVKECDDKVQTLLDIAGGAGLSLGVIHDGHVLHTAHFGYRDVKAGLAPNDDTRYNMNSLSKGVVANLVASEIRKGSLDWDTRVKSILPDFRCREQYMEDHVTIIDLLSHRTGLTSFDAHYLRSDNNLVATPAQVLRIFGALPSVVDFRTTVVYNNWGYEVVQQVLEKITGQTLAELLHSRIFKPLGLSRTSTAWFDSDENASKSYAVLHDLTPWEIQPPQIGEGKIMEAAGGVKSTLGDLLKFYGTFLKALNEEYNSNGEEVGKEILGPCLPIIQGRTMLGGASLHEQSYAAGFIRSQIPGQLGRLGLNTLLREPPFIGRDSASRLILYHHGSMPGSTSVVYMAPATQTAVIVLQNSLAPVDIPDYTGQMVLEHLFAMPHKTNFVDISKSVTKAYLVHHVEIGDELMKSRRPDQLKRPASVYCGSYWNETGDFQLQIVDDDGLKIRFYGLFEEQFDLSHQDDDVFSWWAPYDTLAKLGRYTADYTANHYLLHFGGIDGGQASLLDWSWDPNFPEKPERFLLR